MTDIDSILERIRVGLARHGRKSKITRLTGLTPAQLAAATKPGWNPTAATIRKIDSAIATLFPAEMPDQPQQPE